MDDLVSRPRGAWAWVLASALLGCGSHPEDVAYRAPQPHRGGTFRLALESPETLDPAMSDDAYEATVVNQIFSGLLRADTDLNVLPDVAQSWQVSADGLEYVFTLRADARFHNARRITARDFVYSFTRLFQTEEIPPGIIQDYLVIVDGVQDYMEGRAPWIRGLEARDDQTLVIRLSNPYPSFLSVLCMDQAKVVPEEEVTSRGLEGFGRAPVGSGPFRLSGWEPGADLVLVANREYFGTPAYLDTLILRPYVNDGGVTERAEFYAGKLDVLSVRQKEIPELLSRGSYSLVRRLELSMEFIGLNAATPPFDDVRVRQAVSLALDRNALKEAAGAGFLAPAGILPPGMPGYTPEPKVLPYDPERARALLTQAGYGPGRPLRFDYCATARSKEGMQRDSVIVASWARSGIVAQLRRVTWRELNEAIDEHTAPAFVITWIADLPDPDTFLYTLLASQGTYNMTGFRSTGLDSLLAAARSERNIEARLAWYRQAERRALSEAPLIPLFNVMTAYAFQPHVRGVEMSPFGICSVLFRKVWLHPGGPEEGYAGL